MTWALFAQLCMLVLLWKLTGWVILVLVLSALTKEVARYGRKRPVRPR